MHLHTDNFHSLKKTKKTPICQDSSYRPQNKKTSDENCAVRHSLVLKISNNTYIIYVQLGMMDKHNKLHTTTTTGT